MSSDSFDLGNYIEVKERVGLFYADHPEGRIVADDPEWLADTPHGPGWRVTVAVYRSADRDALPAGRASSFMACPGTTPYTRRSELENVETSAAGRALALAGIATSRGVSSADDVRRARETAAVPRAEAKGRLVAACQGNTDTAAAWWDAAGLTDAADVHPEVLAVLERLAASSSDPEPAPEPTRGEEVT